MVKKFQILSLNKVDERITEPITKFGGQPVWVEEPQWPVSKYWEGRLMMFVGQIVLEKGMLDNGEKVVAYIFITHPTNYEDNFFDADIEKWQGGENAVIIQPGGIVSCDFKKVKEGPTLFDKSDNHFEYIPDLEEGTDPYFISQAEYDELDESDQDEYIEQIGGSKIGGVPFFFRGDELPGVDWKLLLQLSGVNKPFELRIGDLGLLYAFISNDFRQGGLLIQG